MPPILPSASVGVSMLTGQSLSINSSSRAILTEATNTTQTSLPSTNTSISSFLSNHKAPPVNVVITSSDPLPTIVVSTPQPILSVTIPAQHIKGNVIAKAQPHNYQIPISSSNTAQLTTVPSILSKPPPVIATQSILSHVAPPLFSAISQNSSTANYSNLDGSLKEKTLDQTQTIVKNVSFNNSNVSTGSVEEHDPCPDFKPIIPLPDEVPVNTGEEGEVSLFSEHAKLFRHVNTNGTKEWKERGVGTLKILHNQKSGKVRLLMRRDQVHKICANHFITPEITLTPMMKNDKAYIWVAHDFADEVVVVETFCVRFKTAEQANSFYKSFNDAKAIKAAEIANGNSKNDSKNLNNITASLGEDTIKKDNVTTKNPTTQSATLGGFVFTSTPTFKPKDTIVTASIIPEIDTTPKSSPFSKFTFGKTNLLTTPVPSSEAPTFSPLVITQAKTPAKNDDGGGGEGDYHAEDFVPTAEFKPVVALPDLVEVKTGEEDMEVLFENRCKLFRYDGDSKEWKERGLGNIKVLKGEDVRILMRREQVHKVCCNHKVLKNMTFSVKDTMGKAIVWTAQDFSEGVLKVETFTARFKAEEQASEFLRVVQAAQTSMDEQNKVVNNSKHHKPEIRQRTTSFGDKFKPAKGSWECKNCYVVNEGKTSFCVACETPKSGTTPKKTEESGPVFSFGNFAAKSSENNSSQTDMIFGQKPITSSWGNAFKPAEGSWECKSCYVRNSGDQEKCLSCNASKNGVSNNERVSTGGIQQGTAVGSVGFGDAFKPKTGTWECQMCLIRNSSDVNYCVSCENPKNDSVPKKEAAKGK